MVGIDAECEKTMSVLVDNVETLVHFLDIDITTQQVRTSVGVHRHRDGGSGDMWTTWLN